MRNGTSVFETWATVLELWDFAIETKASVFEIGSYTLKGLTSPIQALTSKWLIRSLTMEHWT
jgi:hypothetical protein